MVAGIETALQVCISGVLGPVIDEDIASCDRNLSGA
jgi:hypothetical protein